MFWIELLIVLIFIFIGAKLRGVGLGIMGGIGLFILVYFFHVKPDTPPFTVLLVILSVITAGMALESAGGLKYLTHIAEKLIRKDPEHVTFIAPFIAFILTFLTGTSHITYSLFPIIADVAIKGKVSPEKPLSASAVASLQAIIASPISAFMAINLTIFGSYGFDLISLIQIYLPATLIGTIMSVFAVTKFKKGFDESVIKTLQNNTVISPKDNKTSSLNNPLNSLKNNDIMKFPNTSIISIFIFLSGIIIVILGTTSLFRPYWIIDNKKVFLNPTYAVSIIMLSTAALISLFCKARPYEMVRGKVSIAGIQAVIAILGISWLGNTLFKGNIDFVNFLLKKYIISSPWKFILFLFFVNTITTSQAATLKMIIPISLAIGVSPKFIIGILPAINSIFFIPNYPTMIAAIEFDRSGSTKVGKFVLNHSFMLPGLISTFVTLLFSVLFAKWLL